jgi:hypothetical protein
MAMSNNMVVVGQEPTLGQIEEFVRQCKDGTLTRKKVQVFLEQKGRHTLDEEKLRAGLDFQLSIALAEVQAQKLFDYKTNIAEMFVLPKPEALPWKEIIAVLLPLGIDNRQAVDSLQKYGLAKWEEADVNKYSGSKASGKTQLFLMERRERPTENTMGKSPDQLLKMNRLWLPLKAYALAFGQYYEATSKYLDAETWTWFPTERLSDGGVACGYWSPDDRDVGFGWYSAGCEGGGVGDREAIEVPLKAT